MWKMDDKLIFHGIKKEKFERSRGQTRILRNASKTRLRIKIWSEFETKQLEIRHA